MRPELTLSEDIFTLEWKLEGQFYHLNGQLQSESISGPGLLSGYSVGVTRDLHQRRFAVAASANQGAEATATPVGPAVTHSYDEPDWL